MPSRSETFNEGAENANQILCALPEACEVKFASGILKLDVPEAEPVMIAKAQAMKEQVDDDQIQKYVSRNGQIYDKPLEEKELFEYRKLYKEDPPIVPANERQELLAKCNGILLRQTTKLVRACADAAQLNQLPFDDKRLGLMIYNEGGYNSEVAVAARKLCGITDPKEDSVSQPSPLDSTKPAGTDGSKSQDCQHQSTGES